MTCRRSFRNWRIAEFPLFVEEFRKLFRSWDTFLVFHGSYYIYWNFLRILLCLELLQTSKMPSIHPIRRLLKGLLEIEGIWKILQWNPSNKETPCRIYFSYGRTAGIPLFTEDFLRVFCLGDTYLVFHGHQFSLPSKVFFHSTFWKVRYL